MFEYTLIFSYNLLLVYITDKVDIEHFVLVVHVVLDVLGCFQ